MMYCYSLFGKAVRCSLFGEDVLVQSLWTGCTVVVFLGRMYCYSLFGQDVLLHEDHKISTRATIHISLLSK